MHPQSDAVLNLLTDIYGADTAGECFIKINDTFKKYSFNPSEHKRSFQLTENDVFFITYGDIAKSESSSPLQNLNYLLNKYFENVFTHVHILPFFPYTSDDGFSVVDYKQVDAKLGSWDDIKALSDKTGLMFDAVVNHISASSNWFQEYLNGNKKYASYFIECNPENDFSMVTRPRTLPLLTAFQVSNETKHVWTTFSADQIDLNFKSPDLLIEIIDVLLLYVRNGAKVIRLDAVSYLWKEQGTTCSNLEKTHAVIKLFRAILDLVAPDVVIVTETNVPHSENIKYFGNGYDEAQMVYQFALPPLVAYSYYKGNAEKLSKWAASLSTDGDTTFFNFLSSHDGVGVIPVSGIITEDEKLELSRMVKNRGGFASYKSLADGSQTIYELNSTYYSIICDKSDPDELNINKFVASQAILLSMRGVPALYYHSMLGSENYTEGADITGMNRTVNRQKFTVEQLDQMLTTETRNKKICDRIKALIDVRKKQTAFNPLAPQEILNLNKTLFSFVRFGADGIRILSVTNMSSSPVTVDLRLDGAAVLASTEGFVMNNSSFTLPAYGFAWITL